MRVRTTLAATVVVAAAIGGGSLVLLASLRTALVDDVAASAERRAEEVVGALGSSSTPLAGELDEDEEIVQVVTSDGAVLSSSANVTGRPPVVSPDDADDGIVVTLELDDDDEELVVVSEEGRAEGRGVVVLVGHSIEEVAESSSTVSSLLTVGGPVLVAIVAATTWWVVGRALAPVDRIRSEVDGITLAEVHRRVAVPDSHDEIARLAETMNVMLGRLEEGHERHRRFVADASHELRSPVATLRQHAEVSLAHPERLGGSQLAEVVLAESARMQRLVDDLLLLARLDAGTSEVRPRLVDLDELVLEEAARRAGPVGPRVELGSVGAGRVLGDLGALRRVVANLVENAVRHAETAVALGVSTRDGVVVVHVDDDGPGIPATERDRVKQRFVRLDEGRARDDGGAGLGLAIADEVIAAHGGSLELSDSSLGGARVAVRLPAATDRSVG